MSQQLLNLLGSAPAGDNALYVEDVFSTYLYNGTTKEQMVENNLAFADGPANRTVLHLTGSTLADYSPVPYSLSSLSENMSISTSVTKYTSGSLSFNGSNAFVSFTPNNTFTFSGDFTIDFWIYFTKSEAYQPIIDQYTSAGFLLRVSPGASIGGDLYINSTSGSDGIGSLSGTSCPINQWNFFRIIRDKSYVKVFCNGVEVGSREREGSVFRPSVTGDNVRIGRYSGNYFGGYISDLRMINGIAYEGSTVPTAAFDLDTLVEGSGGMVWTYNRTGTGVTPGSWIGDTERPDGGNYSLRPFTDGAVQTTDYAHAFTSFGYAVGTQTYTNVNAGKFVSWSFRKAPKFFDMVTYTGDGTTSRQISHNLGSAPGFMIIKRYDSANSDWQVYHKSLGNTQGITFGIATPVTSPAFWNDTSPTSTNFTVGESTRVNQYGASYVAYLFADDAGGFGDAGDESIIKCGTYTGNGSGSQTINLGWEPELIFLKRTDSSTYGQLRIIDGKRGLHNVGSINTAVVFADGQAAEDYDIQARKLPNGFMPTDTTKTDINGATYIYVAFRRGPMKTATSAKNHFMPIARTGVGANETRVVTNVSTDMLWIRPRTQNSGYSFTVWDRVRGVYPYKSSFMATDTSVQNATQSYPADVFEFYNRSTYYGVSNSAYTNASGWNYIEYHFGRAPGFFDIVNIITLSSGLAQTVPHNLGVKPEIILYKRKDNTDGWRLSYGFGTSSHYMMYLNSTAAQSSYSYNSVLQLSSEPTSTSFETPAWPAGREYIAYLFASCPGVSKIGTYTGNGTSQSIDCGFTNGARFVMIKRTDSTGDWFVWDSDRGIVDGNDPFVQANSSTAEDSSYDLVDPYAAGFGVTGSGVGSNGDGASYFYLAIA